MRTVPDAVASKKPDVAVVGASPAGLAAAHASAAQGLDTLLLEAGEIGHPEPPAVVGFQALWPEAWRPPEEAIRYRFPGVELTFPGDNEVRVEAGGRIVDRTEFDRWAAERARRAGAEVRSQTGPWEVREPGCLHGPAGEVRAAVVVFADGGQSIANAIVDPVEAPERLVWGVTHELDVSVRPQRLPIRVDEHAPGGRTQLVPIDGETTWHWTFSRRPREEAVRRAEASLQATARRRGWPEDVLEGAHQRHVAPDPVLQRPARLAGPRTLVAGGAGGLGGLEVGLASGRSAGQAAARALRGEAPARRALEAYAEDCRRRFGPAYRGLDRLFRLSERLPDAVLSVLAQPQAGRVFEVEDLAELVDGGRPWGALAEITIGGLARQARRRLVGLN